MNSLISFIFVLGVLVFVHEFGHFLFAKLFGVRVLKFSLGFGGKLVSKKWGETEYLISAFPLGGYVKMFGEHQEEEIDQAEQARSFSHKTVWQRFCIVAGGPVFNLLFAVVLFFGMYTLTGLPEMVDTTEIGEVSKGSAAELAGINPGDIVQSINGQETTSWLHVSEIIKESGGKEVVLVVDRQGESISIVAQPRMETIKDDFGVDKGERYLLGISIRKIYKYNNISFLKALEASFITTWRASEVIVIGIKKMIERVIPASELGGPIRIAVIAGEQMEVGWFNLFYFMGVLSVNLGILNLLPIPVLDGGHLVFLTIEGIRRRPLSDWAMEASQRVGIFLLLALMVFVFYNDIKMIVWPWITSWFLV